MGKLRAASSAERTQRAIEPELLDELAPGDPRAIRSRRDLRRINALMMNDRLLACELLRAFPSSPPRRIAEIGAGDGSLMLRVAGRIEPHWQSTELLLVDRQYLLSTTTRDEFHALGWSVRAQAADVLVWIAEPDTPDFDVIVANLFLHHFDSSLLRDLMTGLARRTRLFIACEPRRSSGARLGSHLLGLIGCNDVSRHDAVVSVRAGFDNAELSALWPAGDSWSMRERAWGLFSHCFVASSSAP